MPTTHTPVCQLPLWLMTHLCKLISCFSDDKRDEHMPINYHQTNSPLCVSRPEVKCAHHSYLRYVLTHKEFRFAHSCRFHDSKPREMWDTRIWTKDLNNKEKMGLNGIQFEDDLRSIPTHNLHVFIFSMWYINIPLCNHTFFYLFTSHVTVRSYMSFLHFHSLPTSQLTSARRLHLL